MNLCSCLKEIWVAVGRREGRQAGERRKSSLMQLENLEVLETGVRTKMVTEPGNLS